MHSTCPTTTRALSIGSPMGNSDRLTAIGSRLSARAFAEGRKPATESGAREYDVAMKIYLACTIRGDRTRVSVARAAADYLMTAGHDVPTAPFLHANAEDEDGRLSAQQVFTRDIAWLNECDALVAEASGSS